MTVHLPGLARVHSSPTEEITREQVKIIISKTKDKGAIGSIDVAANVFKDMESLGIDEVTVAVRKITNEGKLPASLKDSSTIELYKGEGDAIDCSKHTVLRLLEHGFEIYEKILAKKAAKKNTPMEISNLASEQRNRR